MFPSSPLLFHPAPRRSTGQPRSRQAENRLSLPSAPLEILLYRKPSPVVAANILARSFPARDSPSPQILSTNGSAHFRFAKSSCGSGHELLARTSAQPL